MSALLDGSDSRGGYRVECAWGGSPWEPLATLYYKATREDTLSYCRIRWPVYKFRVVPLAPSPPRMVVSV